VGRPCPGRAGLWVALAALPPSLGGRVLVLHPKFAASHVVGVRVLTARLLARGHEVYVVHIERGIPPQTPHPNLTETIVTLDNSDGSVPLFTAEPVARGYLHTNVWTSGFKPYLFVHKDIKAMNAYCRVILGNATLMGELQRKPFDVAVVDLAFNECGLALAHHLGAPTVGYWCTSLMGTYTSLTVATQPLLATPSPGVGLSAPMGPADSLLSYAVHWGVYLFGKIQFAFSRPVITEYLPDSPRTEAILANLSGLLINSSPAVDLPRLLPPTFLHVGGFHILPPPPLPEEIDQYLGSNAAGTVVVSFGSVFSVDSLPPEVLPRYAEAFAKLPFNVLIKLSGNGTGLPRFSANVRPVRWLPQLSLLADRRVVAFVTHCGMHSVLEAASFGVPVVGVPLWADQQDNLLRLVEKDAAVAASTTSTAAELAAAITAAATDPKYKRGMAAVSQALEHQRQHSTPLATAVWLLEHLMLTGGAPGLKITPGGDLWLHDFTISMLLGAVPGYLTYRLLSRRKV